MSTSYKASEPQISYDKLVDDETLVVVYKDKFYVVTHEHEFNEELDYAVRDGQGNYIHVDTWTADRKVSEATQYGANDVDFLLDYLDLDISEHDDDFYEDDFLEENLHTTAMNETQTKVKSNILLKRMEEQHLQEFGDKAKSPQAGEKKGAAEPPKGAEPQPKYNKPLEPKKEKDVGRDTAGGPIKHEIKDSTQKKVYNRIVERKANGLIAALEEEWDKDNAKCEKCDCAPCECESED